MNKVKKKCYIDNRFRTFGSIPDSGVKCESKEQLDLPGNTAMSMIFQFLTHGEQLGHITTSFYFKKLAI